MAVTTPVPPELQEWHDTALKYGIKPREGVAAFTRILQAGLPQVAVSTKNLQALLMAATSSAEPPTPQAAAESAARPPTTHARPSIGASYVPPSNELEQTISAVWQELLGVDQIGIHDNFFELGGHSLLAIQLNSRLSALFQVELSIQSVFDAPTVAQLATTVEKATQEPYDEREDVTQLLEQIEQLSEDEVRSLLAGRAQAE